MKTFFLSFMCIIMLTGCNDDDSSPAPFEPVTITPILISKNYLSGGENIPQQSTVISNQTDWNNLITQMNSINNVSNNFTEINIDFTNYIILLVLDRVRPTTSYTINIVSIIEYEENIIVDFTATGDPLNGFTGIRQPYHIVKIRRSSKPVIFQ
ncbi:hypothetical protein WFZ85_04125 [Flavobacterium sp. j3]|uniref:PrcB C-terminal domain-containing protein n=1 Tax=Flavobacterium aureirubrum TaxID=3133147 RepID=A0ABU9N3P6_9FLAO